MKITKPNYSFSFLKGKLRPSEMVCSVSHRPNTSYLNPTVLGCFKTVHIKCEKGILTLRLRPGNTVKVSSINGTHYIFLYPKTWFGDL